MRIGELFAGIGGLGLGAQWSLGGRVTWQVEHDAAACRVLRARAPDGCRVIEGDVRDHGSATLEPVDLLCGGFPCQDLSIAGKRAGLDGERSGLYRELLRIVGELRPGAVLVENVPALAKHRATIDGAFADLGYRTRWTQVAALDAGAPHRRQRVFVLALRGEAPEVVREWRGSAWTPDVDASPWPTPIVQDARGDRGAGSVAAGGGTRLGGAVRPWPTPTIRGNHNVAGLSPTSGDGLETAARPWPTPKASDAGGPGVRAHSHSLTTAVRPWPTPCARDYRTGAANAYQERRIGTPGLCDAVLGRLSPAWVETLMGLPIGWTDPGADLGEAEAMGLLDAPRWPAGWVRDAPDRGQQYEWEPPRTMVGRPERGRPARLRQLGNAVVPAQAAAALSRLLGGPGVSSK